MLFFVLQLLAFLGFFIGLAGFFRLGLLRGLIAVIGALLVAFELMSVTIGGALIDYKFYAHFKLDVATQVGGFFEGQVGLVLLTLALSAGLIYWLGGKLNKLRGWWAGALLGLLCTGGLLVPGGILTNIIEIVRIHFAEEKAFQEAVTQSGLENYVPKEALQAQPGKNIIAIFMESLEIGYLQENMAHLTPNMQRLRQEMTFYPMTQNEGGDYTIGGLYSYLTGIPMHFKNTGNDVFTEAFDFRLSSVPAVLEKAGYYQEYLAGKPAFAGMDNMFKTMGVTVKSERNYHPKYRTEPWGLHDRDLFEIVNFRLDSLYAQKQPFAYYISTISTHATDGVPDTRVEASYPKQASRLELMALALDDYIGQLIDQLKASGKLANTAIFLLPDHLLLSSHSRVLDDFEDPRQLFLLTNKVARRFESGQTINQIHLPQIILDGAGIRHNFTTLADQLPDDPRDFLEENKLKLLQLNEAALSKKETKDDSLVVTYFGESFDLQPDVVRLLSRSWTRALRGQPSYVFAGREVLKVRRGLSLVTRQNGAIKVEQFDTWGDSSQVNRLIEQVAAAKKTGRPFWILGHDSVGKYLKVHAAEWIALGLPRLAETQGKKAYIAYFEDGYFSEAVNDFSIDESFPIGGYDTRRSPREVAADAKDPSKWIAHAGGTVDGITYANFAEALDHNYAKGFRYFELDILETTDGHFVAAHDWNHWKNRTKYEGETPVSHRVFMDNSPLGKYTPLDMAVINRWFAAHPDAILVSDKINRPKAFAEQFVDKGRLIMELFSFAAIEEAAELGIKEILLSEVLAPELVGEPVEALKKLGVSGMAFSIKTIMQEKEIFRSYKNRGIKVYAFHIGGYGLMDEAFMARYGLDFAYGLYADEWSLLE